MKKNLIPIAAGLLGILLIFSFILTQAKNQIEPPRLRLHRGELDLSDPDFAAKSPSFLEAAAGPYRIIQFYGPIALSDRSALEKTGVTILEYLPDFAYLVRGTPAQLDRAAGMYRVYASTEFSVADKLAPGILQAILDGTNKFGPVQFVPWPGDQGEMQQAIAELPFSTKGSLSQDQLLQIARQEAVRWIEPVGNPRIVNNIARDLVNLDAVWEGAPLYGNGQVIGITDTGLDTGNLSTMSPDFAGRIAATYALTVTGNWADEHGHGTHVAGSAAGAGVHSGAITATHSYSGSFAGVAPEAQLVIQGFEADNLTGAIYGLPADYYPLFDQMYNAGVRLHSNSWGDITGDPGSEEEFSGYAYATQRTDEFIWSHPDMAIFFAAGNSGRDGVPGAFGFCTGGDGVVDSDSLLSPGTAKNVITVAASETTRNEGPIQGLPWLLLSFCFATQPIAADLIANNPVGMAAFSSRGPVDDGRIKPDLTSPGVNIVSNRTHVPGATTLWGVYNDHYLYSGGTSMATPLTAGMGALVREWIGQHGLSNPSAALIKAVLLNTTYDMAPGQYGTGPTQEIPIARPNSVAGWGRADLSFMVPEPGFSLWFEDHISGLNTGESVNYTGSITQPLEVLSYTHALRVMVVWTDPPPSLPAATHLVNDLDLVVTGPGGTTYYGNNEPTGDRLNNVEGVIINNPPLGDYQVSVSAYNIPISSQPYALVVAGPLSDETGLPPTSTPGPSPTFTPSMTPGSPTPTPTVTPIGPTPTPIVTPIGPTPTPTNIPIGTPVPANHWLFMPVGIKNLAGMGQ